MKILVILGSGGHTAQMMKLLKLLGNRYEYEYLVNDNDEVTGKKITGKVHILKNPRLYKENPLRLLYKGTFDFVASIKLMKNFDAVISAGPGISVPVFYAAKMLRKKTIYLESWSRASSMSVSGKLCYPISDLFFIQWPQQKKNYKKAIYAGRLG